jgi:hypothetical protein
MGLKISGKVKFIQRVKIKAPDDGVHVNGSYGFLKGVHSVYMDDKLIPKGSVGFFYEVSQDMGVKVYIGGFPDKPWTSKREVVEKAFKRMLRLSLKGFSPPPKHVIPVSVKWEYNGKKFSKKAWGLEMTKVSYPIMAWEQYAKGYHYDWTAIDHPDHSPAGYHRFCKELREFCLINKWKFSAFNPKKNENPKLGDILFDTNHMKWFLVDCD